MVKRHLCFLPLTLGLLLITPASVPSSVSIAQVPTVLSTKAASPDVAVLKAEAAALKALRPIVKDLLIDTVAVAGDYGLVAWEGEARLEPHSPDSPTWPCTGLGYLRQENQRWRLVHFVYYPVPVQDVAAEIGFPADVLSALYEAWNPLWRAYFEPMDLSQFPPAPAEEIERQEMKLRAEMAAREKLRQQLGID